MANLTSPKYSNIARPYALAAFEYAKEHDDLAAWKAFLASAKTVIENPQVTALLANPEVSSNKLFELLKEVLVTQLDDKKENLLHLLVQNKRLLILPEIAELFNAHYAALEKLSAVKVVTAIETDEAFRQKLKQALTQRMHREVTLHCEVDPSIIGGAIIHLGDRVIDGSIRGKLTRLLEFSLR